MSVEQQSTHYSLTLENLAGYSYTIAEGLYISDIIKLVFSSLQTNFVCEKEESH